MACVEFFPQSYLHAGLVLPQNPTQGNLSCPASIPSTLLGNSFYNALFRCSFHILQDIFQSFTILLKPPTQIHPLTNTSYIPLTSSLSFTNKRSFRRIPWASWHQIYQCPFLYLQEFFHPFLLMSTTNYSSCILDPTPSCFPGTPFSSLFSASSSSVENRKEHVSSIKQAKATKSLPDPVLATSYCPPRSLFPLPVFTYSVQLLPSHQFPTIHCGLGSPTTTSLKLSSIFINKCCHQIPGALFSCHCTMSLCSSG